MNNFYVSQNSVLLGFKLNANMLYLLPFYPPFIEGQCVKPISFSVITNLKVYLISIIQIYFIICQITLDKKTVKHKSCYNKLIFN